jgi:tetraacyldisaccharide 4'-kinase
VMILTRGYKGALENKSGILHTEKRLGFNPYLYGDEATMLIRRLKNAVVVVGKRRAQNLDYYFDQEEPDVVLLDDGHQHLSLKRDLNIVLFDALLPLERYKTAPAGYLREGLSALQDADVVVLGRVDQVSEDHLDRLKKFLSKYMAYDVPMVEMFYKATALKNTSFETLYELDEIRNKNVICLAGIASPQSFFDLVRSLGANVVDCLSFPDHHHFDHEEVEEILASARESKSIIITTEKDIVKIGRLVDDPLIAHLEIQVAFQRGLDNLTEKIDHLRHN